MSNVCTFQASKPLGTTCMEVLTAGFAYSASVLPPYMSVSYLVPTRALMLERFCALYFELSPFEFG